MKCTVAALCAQGAALMEQQAQQRRFLAQQAQQRQLLLQVGALCSAVHVLQLHDREFPCTAMS